MDELSISWDDFHEEFVSFNCISNAYKAAKELGMPVGINIVQSAKSRWTVERVKKELKIDSASNDVVLESPLNLTGRAVEKLKYSGYRSQRVVGPCPCILTGPALSPHYKLLACCGVISNIDQLVLEQDFSPNYLTTILERSRTSTLFNWLYLRGPYDIIKWISERYSVPVVEKNKIGGNCEACKILFKTKELCEKLPFALAENSKKVADEMQLLNILGFNEPNSIMSLWKDESVIVDNDKI